MYILTFIYLVWCVTCVHTDFVKTISYIIYGNRGSERGHTGFIRIYLVWFVKSVHTDFNTTLSYTEIGVTTDFNKTLPYME